MKEIRKFDKFTKENYTHVINMDIKRFNNFSKVNEEEHYDEFAPENVKKNIEKMFSFTFTIEPKSINVIDSSLEDLRVEMTMNNGDTLYFDSSFTDSPHSEDVEKNFTELKINGEEFEMTEEEKQQSIAGAQLAYKRFLKS